MAMTLQEKIMGCTKTQIEGATKARCLQAMLGHLSQWQFEELLYEKLITNCLLTFTNVTNAHRQFGPDLAGLRGKMV